MDRSIWQNIVDGDKAAYEKLYLSYFTRFYNYGKKFTGDVLLIEDCIQEVFLEIWRKKEKIGEMESPNSYFYAAFRLILLQHLRRHPATTPVDTLEDEPSFLITQAVQLDGAGFEARQRLQAALRTLTSRQREAVFLRFYEGFSYEEVARVLEISVKATYKIMARSLDALRQALSR